MNMKIERSAPVDVPAEFAGARLTAMRDDLPSEWNEPAPMPGGMAGSMPMSEEDMLYQSLAEAGGEGAQGFVSVFRIPTESGRKKEWLARKDVPDFLALGAPWLAEQFGPGEYEIMIYTADKQIFKRPRITIGREAARAQSAGGGASDLSRVMDAMNANFARLAEALSRQAPAPVAPGPSRMDMLNEMMVMKNLFSNPGGNSGGDQMGQLKTMLSLVKEVMPRPEGAEASGVDLLMKLADTFAPAIVKAVENMPANLVPAVEPGQAVPGRAALPVSNLTPEQEGARQMSIKLKGQLMYLCSEAKQDSDPAPYAQIIVNNVPEAVLNQFVNSETWLNELGTFHAGVLEHEAWFSELREEVIAILSDPDNLEADSLKGNGLKGNGLTGNEDSGISSESANPVPVHVPVRK